MAIKPSPHTVRRLPSGICDSVAPDQSEHRRSLINIRATMFADNSVAQADRDVTLFALWQVPIRLWCRKGSIQATRTSIASNWRDQVM